MYFDRPSSEGSCRGASCNAIDVLPARRPARDTWQRVVALELGALGSLIRRTTSLRSCCSCPGTASASGAPPYSSLMMAYFPSHVNADE